MESPKVSFVVPCYKLAHFLPDCINSILTQTYKDFEIIIMDDCSPDNTPEVARTFTDKRIKYIRNVVNMGHTNNFNKGISISKGKYVWLISADDLLRTDYILEKYVTLMESNPQVGYVFCPAIKLRDNTDRGIEKWTYHGSEDCVFKGKEFLHRLLNGCCIPAAGAMVRKECYDKISLFPADLSYAEDWYMWSTFAFHYDVGYLSEPMVYYREHGDSISNVLSRKDLGILISCDFAVLGRIREEALRSNLNSLAAGCIDAIADRATTKYFSVYVSGDHTINENEAKEYITKAIVNPDDVLKIYARVNAHNGDYFYFNSDVRRAAKFYRAVLIANPFSYKILVKYVLLMAGRPGALIRTFVFKIKSIKSMDHKSENLLPY